MIDATTFHYLKYIAEWGKSHVDVTDFNGRLANFIKTHNFIEEINAGNETHTAAHNQFSDWHHAEYKQMLGYVRSELSERRVKVFEGTTTADSVNWVEAGLSPPLVLSKVLTSLPLVTFSPSPSSSSSIVPTSNTAMATWDAMVVSRPTLTTIMRTATAPCSRMTTPIPLAAEELEPAHMMLPKLLMSRSLTTPTLLLTASHR